MKPERATGKDAMGMPLQVEEPLSRVARRKEQTHKRLLEVARKLFSDKGIYWTKVEDITESADLGKGTFYKYFDSKETIIHVLLEEGLGELMSKTEQAVREAPSEAKTLSAVIATRIDFFLTHPDYLLFFHQVRGLMQLQVGAAKDLCEVYDAHLRKLAQLVRPVIGTGGSVTARELATAIASFTSGTLTYHALFEGPEALKRRRDHIVQMLERSVLALLKT